MKRIAGIVSLFALSLILGAGCHSRQKDVLGWEAARWGMSEKEILEAFNSRLTKLPKREMFRRWYVDYVIPDLNLKDETYTVFFQMDKETDKLSQILIRLNAEESRVPREHTFNSLASLLSDEYGSPSDNSDDRYTLSARFARIWKFPTTTVELHYGWDSQINSSLLTIRYFPTR